jgi:hypothetical protein
MTRYAENSVAAKLDLEAEQALKDAVDWEKRAENATSPNMRSTYLSRAGEFRKKAKDCLESAKLAGAGQPLKPIE